ncbi:MAG TPA: YggS family pyridoxal phosphate-dependent enzyme [Cyanobacteria bacterium UBA11149]|nr:YggS family pyridoxal phosphate-dependent enzyme [Cyanobacteria bacterium UBA11367]HBE56004.1 YggS family pyridoxal phosphate-dependent enzyme [Cyanobacteria bacterium UBA11366]HBK66120.1 YggS family pyridoxal phosphate-dependent enzyme [Cyanobacteria bacterium UBA11166]HBR74064.1 YggS family pyridoxal phosphate-dependent enzyme [Cyanobacteria bacterium UBA11159]HBS67728.1 YggS family pyridoxal phosphate-dependent enzyme [Cyanobacteria bacterium UBA11153]HBW91605.1 YggS family pyridoxal pho
MTSSIAKQITHIRQELPTEVRLIAVSKQVSVDAMREAYSAGVRDFGESQIQEAAAKQACLADLPDINWHLIGHLQSNKVKKALEIFTWIHSCDSLALAQRLNRLASELSLKPNVCLQVKIVPDPHKYGWTIPELLADLPELDRCDMLQIKGLMTILPLGLSEAESLAVFEGARNLSLQIQAQNWLNLNMEELSMGMSGDYHLAVRAGATMVRLGHVIFGDRLPVK